MRNSAFAARTRVGVTVCIYLATVSLTTASSMPPHARLAPGLEYLHHQIGTAPLSIHVVKIDRAASEFSFSTSLGQDTVLGLEALSSQMQGLAPNLGRALVAVNGDFFRIRPGPYQGDPRGLQLCQGELVSSPHNLSFWIDAQQQPHIDPVQADFLLIWPDQTCIPCAVNQASDSEQAVLYTPSMGASTRTSNGIELVLERCADSPWLPIEPGQRYRARIARVSHDPNSSIAPTQMILHVGEKLIPSIQQMEAGVILSLAFQTKPDLRGVKTAVSGGPRLIRDGQAQPFSGSQPRHPRTALGWNDTHYLLLVVDGRQKDLSVGMTLPELADYMLKLGCTEAMNLDGGGSSTLWLNGRIMNSPSDGRERRIANGLILLQKDAE